MSVHLWGSIYLILLPPTRFWFGIDDFRQYNVPIILYGLGVAALVCRNCHRSLTDVLLSFLPAALAKRLALPIYTPVDENATPPPGPAGEHHGQSHQRQ